MTPNDMTTPFGRKKQNSNSVASVNSFVTLGVKTTFCAAVFYVAIWGISLSHRGIVRMT